MDDTTRYHGTLVSLEGPVDVLATQLRLLPTSPQIFILPQVQTYLEDGDPSERFDARNFIRRMHNAVTARNEVAYSFLKDSTPANKRLVFMNGSTPGAQAICIKTIAEHETDGDISHAELLFNDIVKHGAAGLEDDWFSRQKDGRHHIPEEDPIVRAMRAAEALDRLTADLQPDTDVDLTFEARPRSMSLPIYSFDDRFGDAAPFYVFGVRSSEDDDCIDDNTRNAFLPATPRFAVTDFGESLADTIATFEAVDNSLQPLRSPSCVGETYEHQTISPRRLFTTDMLSPRSGHSIESTDAVVYGEASLMQMQMANARRSTKRTKSLDRAYQTGDSYWDSPPQAQSQAGVDSGKALSEDGRRNSNVGTLLQTSLPRTIHVRCDRPIVLLSPPPPKPKKKANGAYVDKGTDAEDFRSPEPPFRPVLPFTEDLVIKIQDGADDNVLEATISAFKAGIYPIQTPEPSEQLVARKESVVKAPKFHGIETAAEDSVNPSASVLSFGPDPDEYDPFAYGPTPLKPANTTRLPLKLKPVTPPTPAHTPSSLSSICGLGEKRFQSCDIAGCKTAIAVQNSLRVLLNVHFPPEDQGYHHFHFSILPEMGGLWKPVFRNAGAESPRNGQRRIDQILAPLANQTHENPFTNPYLLATLIVPHLEPYFVIHNEVRFLILEYPPDHLATVLALQKLVGVDLMKVAAIVNSDANEPLPFNHVRGASITNVKEGNLSGSTSPQGRPLHRKASSIVLPESVAVSRANFLLTSTATEAEIGNFVSTIRKLLIDVSRFYVSDEPPRQKVGKRLPTPISASFSPFPRTTMGLQSPPLSPPPQMLPPPPRGNHPLRPPSPAMSSKAPSFAETVKTNKSSRSRRAKSRKSGGTFGPATDCTTDSTSVFTFNLEDDSDYDQEERRLMPIFMSKPHLKKGNSHKALKFLGLA
ncbi:uncharacterized protein VDAG_07487 [Verticillium dahliae VdLs.17]|uniref:Gastric mucin-like protein n=1 Tax=Verticillium dahliae (strain VdLs.17 / ATCC MYA-4575 / FGSC 10137) TaxID=498257 RepID=G2XBF5_VERDV|nr:uncharacterized protein VDAG_07487 [Verticillium dahliae VdLs.17]EGY16323.1 hypothetical protein VDAG_07487 [Verticillium dahliae VdLs.17]KAH6699390.1 hypothetical protein EV126DRAFT_460885 [Verticillium dahliae]